MTYSDRERSVAGSQPVEFYQFQRTTNEVTESWRYVNAPTNRSFNGDEYLALPGLQRSEIEGTGESGSMQVELTLPRTCTLAIELRDNVNPAPISITIYRAQKGLADAESVTIHVGEVGNCLFQGSTLTLTCFSEEAAWSQTLGRVHYQRKCPHVLYDQFCGALISPTTLAIESISADRRTVGVADTVYVTRASDTFTDTDNKNILTHAPNFGITAWKVMGAGGAYHIFGNRLLQTEAQFGGRNIVSTLNDVCNDFFRVGVDLFQNVPGIFENSFGLSFRNNGVDWPNNDGFAVYVSAAAGASAAARTITIVIVRITASATTTLVTYAGIPVPNMDTLGRRLVVDVEGGTFTVRIQPVGGGDDEQVRGPFTVASGNLYIDDTHKKFGIFAGSGSGRRLFDNFLVQSIENLAEIYRAGVLVHNGRRYFITQQVDGNITLQTALATDAIVGYEIQLIPGCNRTVGDCHTIHNNLSRFGGFPAMPERNPWTRVP